MLARPVHAQRTERRAAQPRPALAPQASQSRAGGARKNRAPAATYALTAPKTGHEVAVGAVQAREQSQRRLASYELARQLGRVEGLRLEQVEHALDHVFTLFAQHRADREQHRTARTCPRGCRAQDALGEL